MKAIEPKRGDARAVTSDSSNAVVVTCNVCKIFGERAGEAMEACRRENLSKPEALDRFEAVVGVRDVSISVGEGEIFCIMGFSGSGKSTLVRHVNRLIEPTAGDILVNGTDVGRLDLEALRALRADKIGMVFQTMALLPHRTVRDNVAFALELRNVDAFTRNETIELVGLEGYGDRMPSELSGGVAATGRSRPSDGRKPRHPVDGWAALGPRPGGGQSVDSQDRPRRWIRATWPRNGRRTTWTR